MELLVLGEKREKRRKFGKSSSSQSSIKKKLLGAMEEMDGQTEAFQAFFSVALF